MSLADRGSRVDPGFLSGILVVGLLFVLPFLVLVLDVSTLFLYLGVGVVFLVYAVACVYTGYVTAGACVALVTLSTFHTRTSLLDGYGPADWSIGPYVYPFHVPLVALAAIYVANRIAAELEGVQLPGSLRIRPGDRRRVTSVELLLSGFVLWTTTPVLFGSVFRPDIAVYFSVLVVQGLVVFALVRRAVQDGIVEFDSILTSLLVTVFGHVVFALFQVANGGMFGLTRLGEPPRGLSVDPGIAVLNLGIVTVPTGDITASLTGSAFVLDSLIILLFPYLLYRIVDSEGPRRVLSLLVAALLLATLRISASDAARGAILLTGVVFVAAFAFSNWNATVRKYYRKLDAAAGLAFAAIVAYPSSASGATSEYTPEAPPNASGNRSFGPESAPIPVRDPISVPLFDLSNLGTRFEQYQIALTEIYYSPLVGLGGGNFRFAAQRYGLKSLPIHNQYLMLAAETGIPGLLLYTLAVGAVLFASLRRFLASRRLEIGAAIAGLLGVLSFGFWDHVTIDLVTSFVPFWILCGALFGEVSPSG